MRTSVELYEQDLALWFQEQAALLKARRFEALDLDHLVEELESLRRQDACRLWHHLRELLVWCLAWTYAPDQRLRHPQWYVRTVNERVVLEVILGGSPSLRAALVEDFQACYAHGREVAREETGVPLETFPAACPWTVQQVIAHGFWPTGGHELETRPVGLERDPTWWPEEEA
jgi:Domain of unknown function DUF29